MRVLILLVAVMVGHAAETVLREVNRTGMRQKSIEVQAGAFTIGHVRRLCRAELGSNPRLNFLQLVIYGEHGGASLPKPTHLTYEHWLRLRKSLVRSPNQIAEMIAVGEDVVLRMREADGRIIREVLRGKDPLHIEVDGAHCDIVYLAFSAPNASILQRVDVYVRTDGTLKPEIGLGLLRRLEPIFPDLKVFVAARNDAWFIDEPSYPLSNPFLDESKPPRAEEYGRTQTLKCGRWSEAVSCRFE